MNPRRLIVIILCLVLGGHTLVRAQDMDAELSKVSEDLAAKIKENGNKKITVLDFTDLQGGASMLGKYVAEQLTVKLVMGKRDFKVLDRANLKSILAEHKLTTSGLVDPENAKKLGQFAGVDALILGTITPKGSNSVSLTAKIITTDTAEIVGAARAEFKTDDTVQQLVSHPAEGNAAAVAGGLNNDAPGVVKSFGDLRVELQPLHVVNGNQFLLTMVLTNQNPKKSIWVTLSIDSDNNIKGRITDSNGAEFRTDPNTLSGMTMGRVTLPAYLPYSDSHEKPNQNRFAPATEVKPGDAISATVNFISRNRRAAAPGVCSIQLEFLLGHDFNYDATVAVAAENFVSKIEAK